MNINIHAIFQERLAGHIQCDDKQLDFLANIHLDFLAFRLEVTLNQGLRFHNVKFSDTPGFEQAVSGPVLL